MKKIIKPATFECKCDITGKDLGRKSIINDIGNFDPSSMTLCLRIRRKPKFVKRLAANEFDKSQSELTQEEIDMYDRWDDLTPCELDFHPEVAYQIYKFLERKYLNVVGGWL